MGGGASDRDVNDRGAAAPSHADQLARVCGDHTRKAYANLHGLGLGDRVTD